MSQPLSFGSNLCWGWNLIIIYKHTSPLLNYHSQYPTGEPPSSKVLSTTRANGCCRANCKSLSSYLSSWGKLRRNITASLCQVQEKRHQHRLVTSASRWMKCEEASSVSTKLQNQEKYEKSSELKCGFRNQEDGPTPKSFSQIQVSNPK